MKSDYANCVLQDANYEHSLHDRTPRDFTWPSAADSSYNINCLRAEIKMKIALICCTRGQVESSRQDNAIGLPGLDGSNALSSFKLRQFTPRASQRSCLTFDLVKSSPKRLKITSLCSPLLSYCAR